MWECPIVQSAALTESHAADQRDADLKLAAENVMSKAISNALVGIIYSPAPKHGRRLCCRTIITNIFL
ncbi:hypothetical protein MINTM020_40190 [Mycobacterium paraintracellulare]|nr:hypothetical protein OCQ_41870 [Mycobacterium paraintracellulare]BCP11921.1 hypothetical protein MINTM020_40190 [Mycobacterium paraintracellulare]